MLRNTANRFGLVAKSLHWSVAVLILGLVWLGWYMVDLTYYDRWYNDSLTAHRALGLLVLVLAVAKIGWALVPPSPAPTAATAWERAAAKAMHHVLYLLMLALPITGYVISSSKGAAIPIFSWFDVPALFSVSEKWRDIAIELHYYLAYGIVVLVAGHAGAAIKHQFIDRDGTLGRML